MDFFEAQARARKRTTRLVALFAVAVLGTIAAGYVAALALTGGLGVRGSSTDPFPWWQPRLLAGVTAVTVAIVGLASLGKWLRLRAGGRAVAEMVGARPVPPQTTDLRERQLLNVVEEMAIASGLPLPAVYVLDEEKGINAFAAGLTASDAVVAVTRGTLEKLNRDELQGVVAHEFSHILNGDIRLNLRLTAILFGILFIGLIGRGFLGGLRHTRPRSGRDNKNGGVILLLAVGLAMLVIGYVGYFFGRLIQAAVSRQREFLADASAVQFTRNSAGITGALKKIGGYALGSGIQTARAAQLGHFFFAQAFRSYLDNLWATHPPLDQRIRAMDSSFDGRYFEPPEVVDVATEPWSHTARPAIRPRSPISFDPLALVATIGAVAEAHTARAREIAQSIPEVLRTAARTPVGAAALVCGLLLSADPVRRVRQLTMITRLGGDAISSTLPPLDDCLRTLPAEARLPLLLLTPPALRQLPPADLARLLETLDELVHADAEVSLFEFALQKSLAHHLGLASRPAGAGEKHSPAEVSAEISVVLSFGACLHAADESEALAAFNVATAVFSGLHPPLALQSAGASDLVHLDAALDKLALLQGPAKKRLLTALASALASDGRMDTDETELLRALSSALDCPMPVPLL